MDFGEEIHDWNGFREKIYSTETDTLEYARNCLWFIQSQKPITKGQKKRNEKNDNN